MRRSSLKVIRKKQFSIDLLQGGMESTALCVFKSINTGNAFSNSRSC